MNSKSYSELSLITSYEERFKYLQSNGTVGADTFGSHRYLNQQFYKSKEWQRVRKEVILRDSDLNYCYDMGHPDHPISGMIIIHHINPIRIEDIDNPKKLLDPENLICVSSDTHKAIHYGDSSFINLNQITERTPNDTCPWRTNYDE